MLDAPEKAALLPVRGRRSAAFDLIDVLAELHLLDVDAIGLGDLAKRTGYVERQLRRWSKQWQDSKTRELPPSRRSRPAAVRGARPAGGLRRPRRLPVRQLPDRSRRWPHRRGARLGAVHARRPARRRRLPAGLLGRSRRGRRVRAAGTTIPPPRRRVPVLRRAGRAVRPPDRLRPLRHRVLRGLLLVAAGRHQRGRLRPLPPRSHGRRRRRPGDVPAGHRGAGRGAPWPL